MLKLYNELAKCNKNFMFSPYSIRDCFRILYDGISGESKRELDEILGLNKESCEIMDIYDSHIYNKCADSDDLNIVNKAYANKNYNLNLDVLSCDSIESVNMDVSLVDKINKLVSDETNGKINNLLDSGSITPDTSLILLNALYFKKFWDFEKNKIKWYDNKVYDSFSGSLGVQSVKEVEDFDVLRLIYRSERPYIESCFSMYIICDSHRNKNADLSSFMESLTDDTLNTIIDFNKYSGLKDYDEVYFNVPCFELEFKSSIVDLLKNIGCKSIFNKETHDFDKIGEVYIDDVIHGSYIKVNESGTEASAATVVSVLRAMCCNFTPRKIKNVIVNSKFSFIIKDDIENQILFMGQIDSLK